MKYKASNCHACVSLVLALAGTLAPAALAADDWTGTIRCEILVKAAGYEHQETQTWTLAGTPPSIVGSNSVAAASWSVTGQGWHDIDRLGSRRVASWTANVPARSAPVAFLVASNQLQLMKWHAQLTMQEGYTGADQFINGGVPQPQKPLLMTVYEWQFQTIVGAPADTQLTGSATLNPMANLGPLQPANSQVSVNCAWALGKGSAPALPPATLPPPTSPPGSQNPPGSQPGASPGLQPDPASLPALGPGRTGGTVASPGGGGATISPGTPAPAGPPRDPANFTATQTGPGQVELRWDAVPGVTTYSINGSGLPQGLQVSGTSTTVSGLPVGTHEWLVTSWYDPTGSLTKAEDWPRASLNVTAQSGRYRVTATRLKIHVEEPDKRYKEHGRNNEIFLTEHAQVIDRRSGNKSLYDGLVSHPGLQGMIHSTPIHGDTGNANAQAFQYRIQAGSVAGSGGIQSGDEFPVWDADQMQHRTETFGPSPAEGTASHPSPGVFLSSEYVPFVLWEGNLNAGAEVAVLRPVVWLAVNTWNVESTEQFLAGYVNRVVNSERTRDLLALPAIRDALGKPSIAPVKVPELSMSGQWLVDRHRPFGLDVNGGNNGAPASAADIAVVLTQEKVDAFLAGRTSGELEVRIRGTMSGGNASPMGDASLFLKIEQVPALAPPSSPRDGLPGETTVDVAPPRPIEGMGAGPEFPPATKGRYRVTGTRVFFHREEYDARTKEHGRNNEISVSKHAQVIDRRSNAKLAFDNQVVISLAHGDLDNTTTEYGHHEFRIRAGTVSASGGIQTGDDVAIWATAATPSNVKVPEAEQIPFVFWEGELNDGVEVVLIRPAVWVISGWLAGGPNQDEFMLPYQTRVANEQWTDFLAIPPIRDALGQPGIVQVKVPQLVTIGYWLMETHRPFGFQQVERGTIGSPFGGWSTWTDRVVVFSREKIEASLGNARETTVEVRLLTEILDTRYLGGDCSLFLKIERLP